jgi:hypothetical protein
VALSAGGERGRMQLVVSEPAASEVLSRVEDGQDGSEDGMESVTFDRRCPVRIHLH